MMVRISSTKVSRVCTKYNLRAISGISSEETRVPVLVLQPAGLSQQGMRKNIGDQLLEEMQASRTAYQAQAC